MGEDLRTADTGTSGRSGTGLSRSDTGSCRRGTGPLCGARSAGCPRGEGNRSRRAPRMRVDQGGQLVGPRGTAAAAEQAPVAAEVEQRRGAPDVELADRVQLGFGIDLDVRQPGPGALQVLETGTGRPARRAERSRELDDGEVGVLRPDTEP